MLSLYNAALWPARGAAWVWSLWTARDPARREEARQRLGRALPRVAPGGVWLHGASVGEARVAGLLAAALRERQPGLAVAVSAVTRSGRAALPSPPAVEASFFLPLDFPPGIRRALDAIQPHALVLVETELWPNLLHEALRSGVRCLLVNARLSPERRARYARWRGLWSPLLARCAAIGAQSADDAEQFVRLGARAHAVQVTGNIKYDAPRPSEDPCQWRSRLKLEETRPVFVAGSTGTGEEALVLDAYRQVRQRAPRALLVLAPRHLERLGAVLREVAARELKAARLSEGGSLEAVDVLVVDRMGALASLYGLGRAAFVGGSLVPVGGHNVLEPAVWGVPVLFGPHHHHVREPAAALLQAGGARLVRDACELAGAWIELLDDAAAGAMGQAARRVIEQNRGALERSVGLIEAAMETTAGSAA